ncbi:MAG TPA: single-stranded DNA-binding protein [Homoserinimonas sp.]|nr:single-stranded DNA-binding protein [Homoserinimonas sp.]
MTDTITLTGLVATVPKHLTTGEGLPITSFRLASSLRRFDRKTNAWVDAGTNWYTVSAFRRLALGAAASISKGDRVIVTGRLRLRDWTNAEKAGMSIEVDADALGHDLNWGTASYMRTMSGSDNVAPAPEDPEPPAGDEPGPEAPGPADEEQFPPAVEADRESGTTPF